MINPPVFGAFNIANGNDATKPASPKAGDQYIATDTKLLYVCYTDGDWTAIHTLPAIWDIDTPVASRTTKLALTTSFQTFLSFTAPAEWKEQTILIKILIESDSLTASQVACRVNGIQAYPTYTAPQKDENYVKEFELPMRVGDVLTVEARIIEQYSSIYIRKCQIYKHRD